MFDVSKLCSRATRSLLLLSVLLGLSSCGGCFGGQGDGSGLLRDAVLGEDEPEKRYKAPVFRVAYSGTLGQNGEVDLFAACCALIMADQVASCRCRKFLQLVAEVNAAEIELCVAVAALSRKSKIVNGLVEHIMVGPTLVVGPLGQ